MRAMTGLGEAEINGLVKIILQHGDVKQFLMQAAHERELAEMKADSGEAPLTS
jgi:hypothetical protein